MSRARDESPFEDSPSKRIPNLPSIGLQHYVRTSTVNHHSSK